MNICGHDRLYSTSSTSGKCPNINRRHLLTQSVVAHWAYVHPCELSLSEEGKWGFHFSPFYDQVYGLHRTRYSSEAIGAGTGGINFWQCASDNQEKGIFGFDFVYILSFPGHQINGALLYNVTCLDVFNVIAATNGTSIQADAGDKHEK